MAERIAQLDNENLFLLGPAEFLVAAIAEQIADVPQFAAVFGPRIDGYLRMDYGMRDLPALRVYNESFIKSYESWFITGDVILDVILPALTRRELQQRYQDTITSALCQQFRRPSFFVDMCTAVPGLNELGKEFSADKSLGFKWTDSEMVPMTQLRANFRIDLRQWDLYLESQGRTKDDPFGVTLEALDLVHTLISAQIDTGAVQVTVDSEQEIS